MMTSLTISNKQGKRILRECGKNNISCRYAKIGNECNLDLKYPMDKIDLVNEIIKRNERS